MTDRRRKGPTPRKRWQPMRRGELNMALINTLRGQGVEDAEVIVGYEAWGNDVYDALVRVLEGGFKHISVKRHDRRPIREWRHLQSIKNEIAGLETWAMEIFPAESCLMDTSNEYHLWCLPPGVEIPFGYHSGVAVAGPERIEQMNDAQEARTGVRGLARQEPWQEGLTTGLSLYDDETRAAYEAEVDAALHERGLA